MIRVEELCRAYDGNIKPIRRKKDDSRSEDVVVNCANLARQFKSDFGHLAWGKHIPGWLLYGPVDNVKLLVKGMIRGDGSSHTEGFGFTTTSVQLAHGMKIMLLRLGIPSTMKKNKARKDAKGVNHRVSYDVRVRSYQHEETLSEIVDMSPRKKAGVKTYDRIFEDEGYWHHKIQSIEKIPYKGPVFNLNVEGPHKYVVSAGLVSNCHPRDNIALSWYAKTKNLSYDWFGYIMETREAQVDFLADLLAEEHKASGLPIVILGTAFKPNTAITTGSPAVLLCNILRERGLIFDTFDPLNQAGTVLPMSGPALAFLGCAHRVWSQYKLPEGSILIDPFRSYGAMLSPGDRYIPVGIGPTMGANHDQP